MGKSAKRRSTLLLSLPPATNLTFYLSMRSKLRWVRRDGRTSTPKPCRRFYQLLSKVAYMGHIHAPAPLRFFCHFYATPASPCLHMPPNSSTPIMHVDFYYTNFFFVQCKMLIQSTNDTKYDYIIMVVIYYMNILRIINDLIVNAD